MPKTCFDCKWCVVDKIVKLNQYRSLPFCFIFFNFISLLLSLRFDERRNENVHKSSQCWSALKKKEKKVLHFIHSTLQLTISTHSKPNRSQAHSQHKM